MFSFLNYNCRLLIQRIFHYEADFYICLYSDPYWKSLPMATAAASLLRISPLSAKECPRFLFLQSKRILATTPLMPVRDEPKFIVNPAAKEPKEKKTTIKRKTRRTPLESEMRARLGDKWVKERRAQFDKSCFLANTEIAELVASYLQEDIKENRFILEANPGFGYLSQRLLQMGCRHLYLYAARDSIFLPSLLKLADTHPTTVRLIHENILKLNTMLVCDSVTASNREKACFSGLPIQTDWSLPPKATLFASLTRTTEMGFLRSLLYMIPSRTGLFQLGPVELLVFMSSHEYQIMNAGRAPNESRSLLRTYPVLYSLLTENKLLTTVDSSNFLSIKSTKALRDDELHLVRLRPKVDLSNVITPPDRFEEFVFFLKQGLLRGTTVSQCLDMWIPQAYRHVLVEKTKPDSLLYDLYFCDKLSSLSPEQIVELFRIFRSHEMFEHSSFKIAMQSDRYIPNEV